MSEPQMLLNHPTISASEELALRPTIMEKQELENLIRTAFHDTTLGNGISLHQAQVCDNYGKDDEGREFTAIEWAQLKHRDVTEDWTALTPAYLEKHLYLSYLDAPGFRYYLPAFMVASLHDDAPTSLSGLLLALCPERDELWEYRMKRYSHLNADQRHAVAQFLVWLPHYVRLNIIDEQEAEKALQNYWIECL